MIKITSKDFLIKDIKKTHLDCSDIFIFIKNIDKEFSPPLSTKVDLNLWSEKLYEKAYNFVVIDLKKNIRKIVALLSFYCNDKNNQYSYIPVLGVLKEYRGLGIAKLLLKECFGILTKNNFKILGIRTGKSSLAYDIYSSLGFKVILRKNSIPDKNNSIYLEKKL